MKIGNYERKELLGTGGQGEVYLCEDPESKHLVAIKILREENLSDERIDRFERETEAAERLADVPHFVKFYGKGKYKKRPYIVMEYIDGCSLDRLIDINVPDEKTLQHRLGLFHQILEAVQCAHEHGVVHRDLKPSNIMVDGRGWVKLMDFGFAVLDNEHTITETNGHLGGTPIYCPVSQVITPKQTDERTDIYSLGVILFEMVTGRTPFKMGKDGKQGLVERKIESPPPSPKSYNSNISQNLENVILRCLKRSADDRFQSLSKLRRSFEACFTAFLTTEDGQVFILAPFRSIVLGRDPKVDIDLHEVDPKNHISHEHGRVTYKNGQYFYEDMGSRNGSYLNRNKLTPNRPVELHDGDKLRLGCTEFVFES